MNRIVVMFATFILLFQTVFSGVTGGIIHEVQAEEKTFDIESVTENDGEVEIDISWSVDKEDVQENYIDSTTLANELTLTSGEEIEVTYEEVLEELTFNDVVIGTYTLLDNGELSIQFDEKVNEIELSEDEQAITGDFTIEASVIEAEKTEEEVELVENTEVKEDDEGTRTTRL